MRTIICPSSVLVIEDEYLIPLDVQATMKQVEAGK